MLLVGLTGGIGAGKSTVAEMLARRGAVVVDADAVARDVVEPGQPAFDAVVARFGADLVGPDGRLDRAKLGERVFTDPDARRDLEDLTHPAINAEFLRRVGEAPADAIVVLDVPLLVESATASTRGYQAVVVVEAPRQVRLARLEERGVARADAEARMAAQATDGDRRAVATWVLDNGSDREHLERQVERVWAELVQRRDDGRET